MLIRLIYASTSHPSVDSAEYRKILLTAQTKNNEASISGMLIFNQKYFMQVLEGERTAVNTLYNKLARDPRHSNLEILKLEEITMREYGNWSMGYAAPTTLNRSTFMKYGVSADFNPYLMSAEACFNMMRDIAGQTVAIKIKEQEAAPAKAGFISRIIGGEKATSNPEQM